MNPSYYCTIEFETGDAVDKTSVLALDDLTFLPAAIVDGKPVDIQFHVSNTGYPYNGPLHFTVSRNDETLYTSDNTSVSIDRDEEAVIEFNTTFDLPTASDYVITLLDRDNNAIGMRDNITITADEPVLSLTENSVIPVAITYDEPTDFVFSVKNDGYKFDDNVYFIIFLDENGKEVIKFTSELKPLSIVRGGEETVKYSPALTLADGNSYGIRLLTADNKAIGERTGILAQGEPSGIDEITEDDTNVRYFNLQGIEIAAPVTGQPVIVVKGAKSTKYIVK